METAIGRSITQRKAGRAAILVALVAVAVEFILLYHGLHGSYRFAPAVILAACVVSLANGDPSSLGLRATPKQGWATWFRWSVSIGVAVAVCIGLWFGFLHLTGREIPVRTVMPVRLYHDFNYMCVVAPVLEEMIYRFILCAALAAVLGPWKTIAVSGLIFGAVHVLFAIPSPENLVGGFFLAWAYLKSGTILLPLLLHSIGNFIALAAQVVGWYVLG